MSRDLTLYISDILEQMQNTENFIGSLNYEEFCNDKKTAFAVMRAIEIIGEASKGIPDAIREQHPDIPWKNMAGMRDKLVHMYFGVNYKRIWLVVKDDFPRLKPLIEDVLNKLKS